MAKILDFIKEQAKKAGINIDDEKFKAFFSTEALQTVEIPDDLTAPIGSALISINDAKNHGDLKNHYYSLALDGLDKSINACVSEFGLTEDTLNALKLEKNSYLKPGILARAIKEAESKKATAGNADKAKIQQTIDDLHAQLRAANEKVTATEAQSAKDKKDMKIRYAVDTLLNGYKTVHDSMDAEVKADILHTVLNKKLQATGAKLDLDEHGVLVLVKHDGTTVYGDNNTPILPKGFVEKTLSDNKFLVVATKDNQQQTTTGHTNTTPTTGQGAGAGATPSFKNAISRALEDAKNGSPAFGGGGN